MASLSFPTVARNCAFVGGSMGLGDAVCQFLSNDAKGPFKLDTARTCRMVATGVLVSGPYSSLNHVAMERVFPGAGMKNVLRKIATSTATAPLSMSLSFTSVTLLTPGKHLSDAKETIIRDVPDTWCSGCFYWPAVLAAVFSCVPLPQRSLATSAAGTVWSVYLSSQMNKNLLLEGRADDMAAAPAAGALPTCEDETPAARARFVMEEAAKAVLRLEVSITMPV